VSLVTAAAAAAAEVVATAVDFYSCSYTGRRPSSASAAAAGRWC